MSGKKDFRAIVLQASDEGLSALGESARDALYYHIERTHNIRREDIPEKVSAFHEALRVLLGEGARVVEKLIAKSLYSRLRLNFEEHEAWTIVDYVAYAGKLAQGG